MAEAGWRIDLNVDLAEGAPWDDELIELASTANICLGFHAGSPELSRRVAQRARQADVRICLHPGYADREGMGRVSRPNEEPKAILELLLHQSQVLADLPARAVKPHGALYHDSSRSQGHASALTAFLAAVRLPLIGFAGGLHPRCAEAAAVAFIPEAFADRGRREDGSLIPRGEPGDMISEPGAAAACALALAPSCRSLCLHGDSEGCVERLRAVRVALVGAGWEIRS
jgi:UPF0271 protein